VAVEQDGMFLSVDGELAIALCPDATDMLAAFREYRDRDGHELCFVPCINRDAVELLATEVDAEEYGLSGTRGLLRRTLECMRIVRSERGRVQMEQHRDMRKDQQHGNQ
jgi:hypothetical protein